MLSKNSDGSFDEDPKHKAEYSAFRSSLLRAKVIERLRHRLSQLLPESSWIEDEQSLIEATNRVLFINHRQKSSGKVSAPGRS